MASRHESLVDLIFGKCALVYGRDFAGKWEGMSIAEVKADWLRELAYWLDRPQTIRHALETLPADKPPNVLQFRALCCSAPRESSVPELPAPEMDAEGKARVKKMLQDLKTKLTGAA
jgi:nucleotide-binding universal stress UspA family protein